MPIALQCGMTPHQFWHEDEDLLESYLIAYKRNISYTAWLNGQYNYIALTTVLANAFAKKGQKPNEYPVWHDPIENIQKQNKKAESANISAEMRESAFRIEQAKQNAWLRNIQRK